MPTPHRYHIPYSTPALSHVFDQNCLASVELGHLSRHNDNKEIALEYTFSETFSCIVHHSDFLIQIVDMMAGQKKTKKR